MKYLTPNGQVVAGKHAGCYVYCHDGAINLYAKLRETGVFADISFPEVTLNPAAINSYRDLGKSVSTNMDAIANATYWLGIGAGMLASQIARSEIYSIIIEHYDGTTSTLQLDLASYQLLVSSIISNSSNRNRNSADKGQPVVRDNTCGIMMPAENSEQSKESIKLDTTLASIFEKAKSDTGRFIAIKQYIQETKQFEFSANVLDKMGSFIDSTGKQETEKKQLQDEKQKIEQKYRLLIKEVKDERDAKLKEVVEPLEKRLREADEQLSKLGFFAKKERAALNEEIRTLIVSKESKGVDIRRLANANITRLEEEEKNELNAARKNLSATITSENKEDEREIYYLIAEEFIKNDAIRAASLAYKKAGNYKDSAEKYRDVFRRLRTLYSSNQVIAAGDSVSFALLANGTVATTDFVGPEFAEGYRSPTQIYFNEDKINAQNVVSISTAVWSFERGSCPYTLVLQKDGRVKAFGCNRDGQCDVGNWNNIVAVSAGPSHSVGIKSDGTVVATGYNKYGACDVSSWENVVAVAAWPLYTLGLTADGKVLIAGNQDAWKGCLGEETHRAIWDKIRNYKDRAIDIAVNEIGIYILSDTHSLYYIPRFVEMEVFLSISKLTVRSDIIAISAGQEHILALCEDGTVLAGGKNKAGECNVSEWKDIIAISAGRYHSLGLTRDGRVVSTEITDPAKDHGQSAVEQLNPQDMPTPTPVPTSAPMSALTLDGIEMIKKLKELLDMGILTQEEFDAKKKVLLDL